MAFKCRRVNCVQQSRDCASFQKCEQNPLEKEVNEEAKGGDTETSDESVITGIDRLTRKHRISLEDPPCSIAAVPSPFAAGLGGGSGGVTRAVLAVRWRRLRRRSPLWRHGGKAHGPVQRSFEIGCQKKVRARAAGRADRPRRSAASTRPPSEPSCR